MITPIRSYRSDRPQCPAHGSSRTGEVPFHGSVGNSRHHFCLWKSLLFNASVVTVPCFSTR